MYDGKTASRNRIDRAKAGSHKREQGHSKIPVLKYIVLSLCKMQQSRGKAIKSGLIIQVIHYGSTSTLIAVGSRGETRISFCNLHYPLPFSCLHSITKLPRFAEP